MERDILASGQMRRRGPGLARGRILLGVLVALLAIAAAGPVGVAWASAESPKITLQPANVEATEPNAATFTAAASGNPAPSVQWEVAEDGVHFIGVPSATSDTLVVEPTTVFESGYKFRAKFTNAAGEATTNPATLTVNAVPSIEQQPSSTTVIEPATATFTAKASGEPKPTVQWWVRPSGGSWEEVSGATSETLTLKPSTSLQNGNTYRAVFKNKVGTATSNEVTLTVESVPRIVRQPTDSTVVAGERASFTASAVGNPSPKVQWEVSTNKGKTFTNVSEATSETLTIEHPALSDSGHLYRAVFKNAAGEERTEAATLTVYSIPSVERSPGPVTALVGQSVVFSAEASGVPTPQVQWQVSSDNGKTWTNASGVSTEEVEIGGVATKLEIEDVTTAESGNEYRAVFTNEEGSTPSGAATLTVYPLPPVTITSPADGGSTNKESQTVEGSAGTAPQDSATVTVALYKGATLEETHKATVSSGGHWNTSFGNLKGGTYTVRAEQAETGGFIGKSEVTFTVNTTPPAVTMTAPANGSSTSSSSVLFEGAAGTLTGDSTTVTVKVFEGSTVAGTLKKTGKATASGGHWSTTVEGLKNGEYTARAEQADELGNVGLSTPVTFTVATPPPVVTVTSPANGSSTSNSSPVVEGTAGTATGDSQVTVRLFAGTGTSNEVGAHTATKSGGSWSYKFNGLASGTYTVRAEQSDGLGNVGFSALVTFTINTTPPVVTMTSPANGTSTSSSSVLFAGAAGILAEDLPAVTVKVFEGSTVAGALKKTGTTTASGGLWSTTVEGLKNGEYTARAEQSDKLGNVGFSTPVTFIVAAPPPTVTVSSPTNGSSTSKSEQRVEGTAGTEKGDSSVAVKLYEGATITEGQAPVEEHPSVGVVGGKWFTTFNELTNGTYTVRAEQKDGLGNVGLSSAVTFTVNKTPPVVTLTSPASGSSTSSPSESFAGAAGTLPSDLPGVTVKVFEGNTVAGALVKTGKATASGGHWSTTVEGLKDGEYTARAEQADELGNVGFSTPVTFTVATPPPVVTVTAPANGASWSSDESRTFEGTAGTTLLGDEETVTLDVFEGAAIEGQAPVDTVPGQSVLGTWSVTVGGLKAGTYTARAQQLDRVGNLGLSVPVTFTVTDPPVPTPPVASFTWFPTSPHTGERVSLASNSSGASSPIVANAWDLAGNGPFVAGGGVLTTSFATVGRHVVRLRVTDGDGLSSIAAEAIQVTAPPLVLMQPFPVVRIVGTDTSFGVQLSLLTVQAPVGARITVTCQGRGCPERSASVLAVLSSKKGKKKKQGPVAVVAFRRFQRSLRAGITLKIRVYKQGEIGKYTTLKVHRGKLPTRTDTCLNPSGSHPMVCPS